MDKLLQSSVITLTAFKIRIFCYRSIYFVLAAFHFTLFSFSLLLSFILFCFILFSLYTYSGVLKYSAIYVWNSFIYVHIRTFLSSCFWILYRMGRTKYQLKFSTSQPKAEGLFSSDMPFISIKRKSWGTSRLSFNAVSVLH